MSDQMPSDGPQQEEAAALGAVQARVLGRALAGLPQALREHQAANPGHGYNCACMDGLIRQVRAAARELYRSGQPEGSVLSRSAPVIERLRYVLDAALDIRWLI